MNKITPVPLAGWTVDEDEWYVRNARPTDLGSPISGFCLDGKVFCPSWNDARAFDARTQP